MFRDARRSSQYGIVLFGLQFEFSRMLHKQV